MPNEPFLHQDFRFHQLQAPCLHIQASTEKNALFCEWSIPTWSWKFWLQQILRSVKKIDRNKLDFPSHGTYLTNKKPKKPSNSQSLLENKVGHVIKNSMHWQIFFGWRLHVFVLLFFIQNANWISNSNRLQCHCYVPQCRVHMIFEQVFFSYIHSRKARVIVNVARYQLPGCYYQFFAPKHGNGHCVYKYKKTRSRGQIYMYCIPEIGYLFLWYFTYLSVYS